MSEAEPGTMLFRGITAAAALLQLKVMLGAIGVVNALAYHCRDIRCGHALDLQLSGTSRHLFFHGVV